MSQDNRDILETYRSGQPVPAVTGDPDVPDGPIYTATGEADDAWIKTNSGLKFSYVNPQPQQICIEDISHHLSMVCRFAGACHEFYTVAEHSVRVAEFVYFLGVREPRVLLKALLHDAAEAYIGDLARPFKILIKDIIKPIEGKIQRLINRVIGHEVTDLYEYSIAHKLIKYADEVLLATEARDLLDVKRGDWPGMPFPIGGWDLDIANWDHSQHRIHPLTQKSAKRCFLRNARSLITCCQLSRWIYPGKILFPTYLRTEEEVTFDRELYSNIILNHWKG